MRTSRSTGGCSISSPIRAIASSTTAARRSRRASRPRPSPRSWRRVSGLPRQEPILDDLLDVSAHNERVERIRDVIETSFSGVAKFVEGIIGAASRASERSGERGVRGLVEEDQRADDRAGRLRVRDVPATEDQRHRRPLRAVGLRRLRLPRRLEPRAARARRAARVGRRAEALPAGGRADGGAARVPARARPRLRATAPSFRDVRASLVVPRPAGRQAEHPAARSARQGQEAPLRRGRQAAQPHERRRASRWTRRGDRRVLPGRRRAELPREERSRREGVPRGAARVSSRRPRRRCATTFARASQARRRSSTATSTTCRRAGRASAGATCSSATSASRSGTCCSFRSRRSPTPARTTASWCSG